MNVYIYIYICSHVVVGVGVVVCRLPSLSSRSNAVCAVHAAAAGDDTDDDDVRPNVRMSERPNVRMRRMRRMQHRYEENVDMYVSFVTTRGVCVLYRGCVILNATRDNSSRARSGAK